MIVHTTQPAAGAAQPGEQYPCARCGRIRQSKKHRALCQDCRYVLSKEEQNAWAA